MFIRLKSLAENKRLCVWEPHLVHADSVSCVAACNVRTEFFVCCSEVMQQPIITHPKTKQDVLIPI